MQQSKNITKNANKNINKNATKNEYNIFTSAYALITVVLIVLIVSFIVKVQVNNPQAFFNVAIGILIWYLGNIVNIVYKSINNEYAVKIRHIFGFMIIMFMVYGLVYFALYNLDKRSFTGSLLLDNNNSSEFGTYFDMLYFTMSVFSTAGFGDITPVSRTARIIVMTQFSVGFALVGILLSRVCD